MDELKLLIVDNLSIILGYLVGGTSLVAYFLERKKRKIEEKQIGADALKTMQDAYDKFTADSLKRYEELSTEVEGLKKKLASVTTQVKEEEDKYDNLKTSYDKLKVSYDNLKREFDNYKKKHLK